MSNIDWKVGQVCFLRSFWPLKRPTSVFLFAGQKRSSKYFFAKLNQKKTTCEDTCVSKQCLFLTSFWDISSRIALLSKNFQTRDSVIRRLFAMYWIITWGLAPGRMHMRCDLGAPPGGVPVVQVPLSHMWAAMLSWTCARTRTPRCFLPPDLVLHFTWVTHSLQLSIIFPKKRLLRSVRIGGFPLFWAPFWSPFWLKVLSHLSSNFLFRIHHQYVWKISLFGRPDQRLPRDL